MSTAARYLPDPAWRLIPEGGLLVLSAGADRLFALEDVDGSAAGELLENWHRDELCPEELSSAAFELLLRLAEAGVVVTRPAPTARRGVAVRWAGEPEAALERWLGGGLAESDSLEEAFDEPDVLLIVRTTARLVELYPTEAGLPVPHLLLDVAYDHTISIGPLVFPGETACLACLAGRINQVWGDPEPPARPSALRAAALAAALALYELEALAQGDTALVNATVAYDLEGRRSQLGSLYRLPWCPVCGDGAESAGRIEIPWDNAA